MAGKRIWIQRICFLCSAVWTTIPSAVTAQDGIASALRDALPRGWECLQGPNDLDHPGTTFYVDRTGSRFELVDLGDKIHPSEGDVSSAVTGGTGRVSAGLLLRILGLGKVLSLSGSSTYSTAVALFDRREARTAENVVRAALRTLDPSLISNENTYFVIRDVQTARRIRITVDKAVAASFGGEVPFKALFRVSGAATPGADGSKTAPAGNAAPIISAESDRYFTIDETYEKPLTVCYLAQRFTLQSVSGGAGGSVRDARLVDEYWNPSAGGAR